jgi:hypothetical protein
MLDPRLAGSIWRLFNERAGLDHAESWTKPIMASRQQANALRTRAYDALAEARLAENPQQRARLEQDAQSYDQQAQQLELKSLQDHSQQMFGLFNAIAQPIREQLQHVLGLIEQVQARDAAQAQQNEAFGGMMDDGAATFGPAGFGIFDTDQAGNVTAVSETGQKILDAIPGCMAENGLPMPTNAAQLIAALRLLSTYAPSDGQPGAQAVQQEPGFAAQVPTWTPGGNGASPSLAGNGQPAPRY